MEEYQPCYDRSPHGGEIKYHLTSLGCPKNLVESEEMMAKMSLSGMVLVHEPEEADLLVVNTCGFIDPAKEETIEVIMELVELRQNNPNQRLVVVGCMVQRYREAMAREIPEVDAFVGVEDRKAFLDTVWRVLGQKPHISIPDTNPFPPRLLTTPPHYAYLRIADGCSHRCHYCTIPLIRGPHRSRPMDEIEKEAESLVAGGVKELIVVSQDTTAYGHDLYGDYAIAELLRKLDRIEGLEWIRLMYTYPHLVDHRLAHVYATSEKLLPYIDMPIQHGDPEILDAMNRGASMKPIRDAVKLLRDARPNMVIRTTVMVGYPGEKQRHFDTMQSLLEELDFDRVGVFTYSREEETPAAAMSGQVSDRIKQKRYEELVEWAAERAIEKQEKLVGEIVPVLIDGKNPEGPGYFGRYAGQAPEVDGQVYVKGNRLVAGNFAPVRISDVDEDNLYGYVNIESNVSAGEKLR